MTGSMQASLKSLENWILKNGYAGYDPYDIKGHPAILRLTRYGNRNYAAAMVREVVFEFFYTFPELSRHLLQVRPAVNAKAMGLFATSFLDLYSLQHDEVYRGQMAYCIDWLKENKTRIHGGIGWGYPFDWQSKMLIPAGTPNGIVTTAAGEAFWKHYRLFADKESLEYCIQISKFLSGLPVNQLSPDRICFSYTSLFQNHVHNLNLFVAEFLIKTGMETGNSIWIDMGNSAVTYTVSCQLPDGAFDYNGPPEKPNSHIDNYHTGFVLRMLYSVWMLTGRDDVYAALQRCYRHYVTHFFERGRIPKLMPDRTYRIDIHSCAESVNCLSVLSPGFPEGLALAENILRWTLDTLQDPSGYFYYGILKSRVTGVTFKSKIPYIRWGQAWMFRALSSYLVSAGQNSV